VITAEEIINHVNFPLKRAKKESIFCEYIAHGTGLSAAVIYIGLNITSPFFHSMVTLH